MKLFTALFVIALASSSIAYQNAAYSDFTNGITGYVFLGSAGNLYALDNIYPNVISSAPRDFSWIQSVSYVAPAEVTDYLVNAQQSYAPWYNGIQSNINNGKATAKQAILDAYASFDPNWPNAIEQRYNQMVAKFAARGCTTFSAYASSYSYKGKKAVMPLSIIEEYQQYVQQTIPNGFVSQFAMKIQQAINPSMSGDDMLNAIKQVEAQYMNEISDLHSNAVEYLTDFTVAFFSEAFSATFDRVVALLDEMVAGADTADCA